MPVKKYQPKWLESPSIGQENIQSNRPQMIREDKEQWEGKQILRPDGIKKSHWNEWVKDSAVDPELTSLCITSLFGSSIYDRLFVSDEIPRLNGGRVSTHFNQKYFPLENGGWWCNGVDVLDNFEPEIWGQFKADTPRTSFESKGFARTPPKSKKIKYDPPPKLPTSIFALPVPLHLWQAIATRYDVELPEDIVITPEGRAKGFWAWVIANPKIPVIITEGAKKAGALISAEYVAIALPGIYNGYRAPKDDYGNQTGSPYLIPQLQVFARENREIIFCFDNDAKPKTVRNVRKAIFKTGKLFLKEGCRVSAIVWNYPEKGVDDLVVVRGCECFEQLYKARLSLSKFHLIGLLDLSKYNPLKINERYLTESLIAPDHAQIIALRSPKGSNKTGWIVNRVQQAIAQGIPVLVITHRIQLAKALCARFGIDHIEEVRSSETKGVFGYGLCIDSLHRHSQALFNPFDWSEAIVILDECEQVIWHMLDSHTCQDNRVTIIENFQQLLKTIISTGGKVYLSDADLSCVAIDYIQKLIGTTVDTWVVDNVYAKSKKRLLYAYSGGDPRQLVAALVKAIERGEKALVHVTGQKAKSNWGSTNLESYLKKKFSQLRILRIDGESVADPHHLAYGCTANLNSILSHYDIAIASPVVETGISIDIKNHFDSVWAIAQGIQTVDAVCQALERLREDVPRHIWVKTTAKGNRIGNGSTSIKGLLASQHKLTSANIRLLQQAGINDFDELEINFSVESLVTWAKRACIINTGKNNYRESVIEKLLDTGYELVEVSSEDTDVGKTVKNQIKATAIDNYQQYCQTVSKMATPTNAELERLNNKKAKTKEERYRERKGNLSNRYGVAVTPQLVEKDDNGWYPQLKLHYYLTIGKAYLAQRDRKSLTSIDKQGQGKAFKPDLNKKQLSAKVTALQLINISQFFDREAEFTKNSLTDWLELVIDYRFDIQAILGISVNPKKDSPIAVAQRLLKKLGLKLQFKCWRGDRQHKQRIYSGCDVDRDRRSLIFDYWLSKKSV